MIVQIYIYIYDYSYITFMIVSKIDKNMIMKYITFIKLVQIVKK